MRFCMVGIFCMFCFGAFAEPSVPTKSYVNNANNFAIILKICVFKISINLMFAITLISLFFNRIPPIISHYIYCKFFTILMQ